MNYRIFCLVFFTFAASARAQEARSLTTEQVSIIYDQCLARGAAQASRTDAKEDTIYGIAKAACEQTRSMLIAGLAPQDEKVLALDAIDRDREQSFPESTRKVREMRRQFEEKWGKTNDAPNK